MSISAFLPVFNEENRIQYALTSLKWCDEIVVLNKTSTDRTVAIAKNYGANVITVPNTAIYDISEFDYLLKHCTSEWVILFTASDIIDVDIALEIKKLTSTKEFAYDVINVPYKRYILGIENKRSPWHSQYHPNVFKKSILKIRKNEVHGAISFTSNKIYSITGFKNSSVHHLTHETIDSMIYRHLRYWRAEGKNYNELSLKKAFTNILRSIIKIFLIRKTFLLGWNGIVLICAYLSYTMISFIYKWENKNSSAAEIYLRLRTQNKKMWEVNNRIKIE